MPTVGTTSVNVTINQVLTRSFPSVLVLQLIRDQDGNPISNLNAVNFDVLEDGVRAVVTDVRTVQQASSNMSVALVLDRSNSMAGEKNAALESAATQFVSVLKPQDYAEVINFDTNVQVTQTFTNDQSLLEAAILNQFDNFRGNTSVFDAIYQGIDDTALRGGRMAVLALTDGGDNRSAHTAAEVVQHARDKSLPVFTIGLGSDADSITLSDISTQSNGTYTFSPQSADLSGIYRTIASQLNGQIQVSFISPNPNRTNTLRHVVVNYHYGSFSGQNSYDYTL